LRLKRSLRCWLPAFLPALLACATAAPRVSEQTYAPPAAACERLAVVPFYVHRSYEGSRLLGGVPGEEASEQVTRLVVAALAERGFDTLPVEEVAAALADVPRLTLAVDALVFADVVGRELGATGVLVGEVLRFRNPRGVTPDSRVPASVAYQVSLFEAPDGFKVWSARFDETQAPNDARGSGPEPVAGELPPKWLSAVDVARRGAEALARSLDAKR
jgi:hypothetical protein